MTDVKELLDKASERRLRLAENCERESHYYLTGYAQDAATELRTADSQLRDMAEALEKVADIVAAPSNSSFRARLAAALDALDAARKIARATLAKLTKEKEE